MFQRPMLASTAPKNLDHIRLPKLASPKLDGIRCLSIGGVATSRTFKPIPNLYIQSIFKNLPSGLDGELMIGNPTDFDVFNRTTSAVMSVDGAPEFTYWVFDFLGNNPEQHFASRYERAEGIVGSIISPHVRIVSHKWMSHIDQVYEFEKDCVMLGYEGIMLREPSGPYKFGRATQREEYLMKVKRFMDAEAEIVGVNELLHNGNEVKLNAFGLKEHSSHKDNKVPMGMLGSFECRTSFDEGASFVTFKVGTGFTELQRKLLWSGRDNLLGKVIKFKYQKLSPDDGAPIFPVYLGFRDEIDV